MAATIQARQACSALLLARHALLQAQGARGIKAASGASKQESMASEAKVRRRMCLESFSKTLGGESRSDLIAYCFLVLNQTFSQAAAKARVVSEDQPSRILTAKEQWCVMLLIKVFVALNAQLKVCR